MVVMWVTAIDTKESVVVYWPQNTTDVALDSVYQYGTQWHYDIAGLDYVSPAIHGVYLRDLQPDTVYDTQYMRMNQTAHTISISIY
jgi:hypothetical protein